MAQTSNTTNDLKSVRFTSDGMLGRATGEQGVIVATGDGGNTWTPATIMRASLLGVSIAAGKGWVVGESGAIATTTDGGVTWQPTYVGGAQP
jgi:photosystem II stability/assembly factor-like uncharacterized protein